MSKPRPRALIETDHDSGDLRITLRGADRREDVARVQVDEYSGSPHPDDRPLTPDQWAHLERACTPRSGTPRFDIEEVRSRAAGVRESAAQALAYRGYLRMVRVRVNGRDAGWAGVPTEAGRAALRAYLAARQGEAVGGAPAR